jgi:hypothetical protein
LAVASGAILVLSARVALLAGYLSDRHLLIVILAVALWAAVGLCEAARRLEVGLSHGWARVVFPGLLAGLTLPPLWRSLEPLHEDRLGYREAGLWLAEQGFPTDLVVDPHCWAAYYAGRAFPNPASEDQMGPRVVYVVLDQRGAQRSQVPTVEFARRVAAHGQVSFRAKNPSDKGKSPEVVVFSVRLPSSACP